MPKVVVWTGDALVSRLDISKEVVSLQVQKTITQPAGSWSITLLPRDEQHSSRSSISRKEWLYRTLDSNRVVSIGFEAKGGIMAGLISRVARTTTRIGDQVAKTLTISGQDFGKLLVQDNIIKGSLTVPDMRDFIEKVKAALGADHPLTIPLKGVWGPEVPAYHDKPDTVNTFQGVSVPDVIDWALRNITSLRVPLFKDAYGGDGRASDFISTGNSVTVWNDSRVWSDAPYSYNGNAYGFLRSILDSDFYEIWVDSIPSGNDLPLIQLVVRPKPFDEEKLEFATTTEDLGISWTSLRPMINKAQQHHEIAEDEVIQENLGYGDSNALSYFLVSSDHTLIGNSNGLKEGLFYPLVDTWNAKRSGNRPYRATLSLLSADVRRKAAGDLDYDGEVGADVVEFRNRLFNWYRLNPFFEEGTIQVVGRDDFRVGDPVFLPWATPPRSSRYDFHGPLGGSYADEAPSKGMRYYCVGVTWSWSFGKAYTCTLQLERGHNDALVNAVVAKILSDAPAESPEHFVGTGRNREVPPTAWRFGAKSWRWVWEDE